MGEDIPLDVYRRWKRWCRYTRAPTSTIRRCAHIVRRYARVRVPFDGGECDRRSMVAAGVARRFHCAATGTLRGNGRHRAGALRPCIDRRTPATSGRTPCGYGKFALAWLDARSERARRGTAALTTLAPWRDPGSQSNAWRNTRMATNGPIPDEPPSPVRTPIASAVILLAFYVAMYLAIAPVVQRSSSITPIRPPGRVRRAVVPRRRRIGRTRRSISDAGPSRRRSGRRRRPRGARARALVLGVHAPAGGGGRRLRDELRELDDRMLHDLGIDRSEIGSVAGEMVQAWPSRRACAPARARLLP